MREEDEGTQRGTDQAECCKKAQVFQHFRFHELQAEKAPDGSEAAHGHGHGKVADQLPDISCMPVMIEHMQ